MASPPETKNPPQVAACEGFGSKSTGKELTDKHTTRTREDYARERYRLDGLIKSLLRADAIKNSPGQYPANVHRSIGCTWVRVSPQVSLVRPDGKPSYHYKGLRICGSVHTCPLCASKIQERRRQEVAQAIEWGEAQGKSVVMVSYTFPHRVDQPLALLLRLQQEAIKSLREGKAYKNLMASVGHAGRIRTLEVTHGRNGWHPHTHELLIVSPSADPGRMKVALSNLWLKACRKVGLFQPDRDDEWSFLSHAVDVRDGDLGAAAYLAKMDDQNKWGLSHEMTKGSSKQGRASGSHPFKLAVDASTSQLFMEYVNAIKGARQLVWSRGLKAAVGLDEKTDEQIAQEEATRVTDRIPLSPDDWRKVIKSDARYDLIRAAETDGHDGVKRALEALPDVVQGNADDEKPPRHVLPKPITTGSVFDWIDSKEFAHACPPPRPLSHPNLAFRKRPPVLFGEVERPEVGLEQGDASQPVRHRRL